MGDNIFRAVQSTLIYIERGDEYLMLHRTKKENDLKFCDSQVMSAE